MFHKSVMGRGSDYGRNDHTLADYIRRKGRSEAFDAVAKENAAPKLTFDEWWSQQLPIYGDKPFEYMVDACEAAWKAAQENCR